MAIISQNAALIRSMFQEMAERLTKKMAKGETQGKRPDELMKEIKREFLHLSAVSVRRIARMETSKASTVITHVRAETADGRRRFKRRIFFCGIIIQYVRLRSL